jgi:SAM-dependent methyltransferase
VTADLEFLAQHRRIWEAKPRLRETYGRYHDMLLEACPRDAVVLELGCGIGTLARRAQERGYTRWVASDILATDSARLRCDATRLPFRAGAVDRIVFVDVLHHLAAPFTFFAEAARVLAPSGSILCVEPWITPASYPIYRWIHHEGCDLSRPVEAPFAGAGSKPAYEGDNGIPTLLCRRVEPERWRRCGLSPPRVRPFNDFAYLTTRGFRETADAPRAIYAGTRALLDRLLSPCSSLLGLRALIAWTRVDASSPR